MGTPSELDLSPDMMHNRGPGIGGEGDPSPGIIAQNGAPEANATGLQGLAIRQVAQYLLAHDRMD
jgi:hypothetical protein